MPYSLKHKQETRARIVQCAHELFNRHGFASVSIDDIMANAGLTRGGFYNHFNAKEDLYAETLDAYALRREKDNDNSPQCGPEMALRLVTRYVSRHHLEDVDVHCPLMALPSDVVHAGPAARLAYQRILESMIGFFEDNLSKTGEISSRQQSLALTATCVGAMVLARTIDDADLADEVCDAATAFASNMIGPAPKEN